MKQKIIVIFVFALLLALLAYRISHSEKIQCESEWKRWEKVGKAQIYTCITYYRDWWNQCSSSNDCEWECIQKSEDATPFCEISNDRFGCGNSVENIAKWEGILCID